MKTILKILLASALFGSFTQIAYATPWSDEAKNSFMNSCVGHATSDPRITANFTFEQIYKTCVCVRDYYDFTYTHEEMTAKLGNYDDAEGAEIAQATAKCLTMVTNVAEPGPVRPKTPMETMKAL